MSFGRIDPSKQPLKKKFYDPDTTYDGKGSMGFSATSEKLARYYPDEDVIVSILHSYLKNNYPDKEKDAICIVTETMNWDEKGVLFKRLDVAEIVGVYRQKYEEKKSPRLLLIPFHYNYHHTCLAIDFLHNEYLYCDPKGDSPKEKVKHEARDYRAIEALLQTVEESKEAKVRVAEEKQQEDRVSCGPILTQCLIEIIDAFFKSSPAQSAFLNMIQFESPRTELASMKMKLMNINNINIGKQGDLIKEEMLASYKLYEAFFAEQKLSEMDSDLLLNYLRREEFFETKSSESNDMAKTSRIEFQRLLEVTIRDREKSKDSQFKFEQMMQWLASQSLGQPEEKAPSPSRLVPPPPNSGIEVVKGAAYSVSNNPSTYFQRNKQTHGIVTLTGCALGVGIFLIPGVNFSLIAFILVMSGIAILNLGVPIKDQCCNQRN